MELKDIKSVLIIGAGTMGHSIEQVYAQNGFSVSLVDVNSDVLTHALQLIEANLNILAEFERVNKAEIKDIKNRISVSTNLKEKASAADLVLEAVKEEPRVKLELFTKLSQYCREDIILASNTSSLDIFKILKRIPHP